MSTKKRLAKLEREMYCLHHGHSNVKMMIGRPCVAVHDPAGHEPYVAVSRWCDDCKAEDGAHFHEDEVGKKLWKHLQAGMSKGAP